MPNDDGIIALRATIYTLAQRAGEREEQLSLSQHREWRCEVATAVHPLLDIGSLARASL